MAGADTLDDALDRLSGTGPEFEGFLSNHAPMTADALIRLGRADLVGSWLDDYRWKLEEAPPERFPIDPEDWREMLGDPSRLGDWCALFSRLVREGSWQDLLAQWWPRLAPGGVAAATHCLIRTGHVVRALSEQETPQRLDEFGRALGYWAARWQPLPAPARPDLAQSRLSTEGRAGDGVLLLDLALSRAVPWRAYLVGAPPRLVLDFRQVDFSGLDPAALAGADLVAGLRWGRFRPGWTRMVVELPGPARIAAASPFSRTARSPPTSRASDSRCWM